MRPVVIEGGFEDEFGKLSGAFDEAPLRELATKHQHINLHFAGTADEAIDTRAIPLDRDRRHAGRHARRETVQPFASTSH